MDNSWDEKCQQYKKVSIVVPCYNASDYLDRCVGQLLHQTIGLEHIEVILVDDASTDNGLTWEMIMKYEKKFPNTIIAISLENNMRQGGARNVGISYASGEYLMFCDVDDWLALEAVEHAYYKAKEYDADVVEYGMQNIGDYEKTPLAVKEGDGSHLVEVHDLEERKAFLLNDMYTLINNCWRKLYRMSMIREHNIRFAEHLIFEEPAFTVPVLLYETRHCFLDEEIYYYYKSPNSTMRSTWDQHKFDNMQVWLILINELEQRGFLAQYYEEIAYLFFLWGYVHSIVLLVQRYTLTVEEMTFFVNAVVRLFPDILENSYLLQDKNGVRILLREVLRLDITEKTVSVINELLKKYLKDIREKNMAEE